jgi:bifunctional non-homologous end joining protein LigD
MLATPIAWYEVSPKLDPAALTIRSVPERVARLREKPWQGFDGLRQKLPVLPSTQSRPSMAEKALSAGTRGKRSSVVVYAAKPKPRR